MAVFGQFPSQWRVSDYSQKRFRPKLAELGSVLDSYPLNGFWKLLSRSGSDPKWLKGASFWAVALTEGIASSALVNHSDPNWLKARGSQVEIRQDGSETKLPAARWV